MKTIWRNIPYSVYFMSCNLDHVLYDVLNISQDEKEKRSHAFAKMYKGKFDDFFEYISKSDFSVKGKYKETWNFIQQGLNSLNRHSNLHLSFKDIEQIKHENNINYFFDL